MGKRIEQDGFRLEEEHCFLDDGYSGSTLLRPALERLRDLVHCGGVDRLYVHSPDRLRGPLGVDPNGVIPRHRVRSKWLRPRRPRNKSIPGASVFAPSPARGNLQDCLKCDFTLAA